MNSPGGPHRKAGGISRGGWTIYDLWLNVYTSYCARDESTCLQHHLVHSVDIREILPYIWVVHERVHNGSGSVTSLRYEGPDRPLLSSPKVSADGNVLHQHAWTLLGRHPIAHVPSASLGPRPSCITSTALICCYNLKSQTIL